MLNEMIRYFTNRELAQKLEINLARWKRWSRFFLPPDPLGGMQSGYARQYLFKDLFTVFLGGFLLGHLKLSTAESQQVLVDVSPWLKKNGYHDRDHSTGGLEKSGKRLPDHVIYFCPATEHASSGVIKFTYLLRETLESVTRQRGAEYRTTATYKETWLPGESTGSVFPIDHPEVRIINLTALFNWVVGRLAEPGSAP